MMKLRGIPVVSALVLAAGLAIAVHADTFALDPVGGALSGAPGAIVGWGFTFFIPTDYAIITSSDYVTTTPVGTYSDFISSIQFNVTGPDPESTTWTQTFDPVLQTGVGEYTIDPAAVVGAQSTGSIELTYDLYSTDPLTDPNFDPSADLVSSGNTISANASITVTPAPVTTPEPGFQVPAGLMLLGLWCAMGRKGPSRN